ncbi:cyclic nucleotide-binding domain-containing protein [Tateyamaria sp. SN3-11]|uniref:cyclic nucleotide-binding domain-containing protein n=1 Tax=Tateyamaria sp. SN3-11 TaxID=3092147 RepID=UPI0039E939F1
MAEFVVNPQWLVYAAGGLYVLGLVVLNQLVLRLFVLTGTAFYIVYYFTVGPTPLWEAIYISTLIGAANITGILALMARRSKLAVPAAHADLFALFPTLHPGDFRALMKNARRYTITEQLQATVEGGKGERLYYVISGTTQVEKGGDRFTLPPGLFVGEVAYLIGTPSSASTWLDSGAEVLEWRFDALRRQAARNTRFKLALDATLSVDLAVKVAQAIAPTHSQWRTAVPPKPELV